MFTIYKTIKSIKERHWMEFHKMDLVFYYQFATGRLFHAKSRRTTEGHSI